MTVRFTERMRGFYGAGAPAYDTGEIIGRRDGWRLGFRLTIGAPDLRAVIADPNHTMTATGSVLCKEFAPIEMPVTAGTFEIFVPVAPRLALMRYLLPFTTPDGIEMTLQGYKELADDVGPDVWTDTSTLFVRLLRGHNGWVDEGDISAEHSRGTLRLTMPMFARQLSTFRGTPSDIAGFGRFFAAQLWGIYRGPARSPLR